ncbi:hypothetical protein BC830DRAFT_1119929 [Chytriomyces sp. MP71]|nr:hypothetical protein BC830DRAFT_1119929 [Chytriomyces sp. MP71]
MRRPECGCEGAQACEAVRCHTFTRNRKSNSRCNANALTQCRDCGGQFCAKHRFYADHQCTNGANSQAGKGSTAPSVLSSRTGSAAQSRVVSAHSSPRITGGTFAASVQAGLPNGRTSEGAANKAPLPVVCPICHKNVDGANTSMSSSQVNQIVTRHIDAGCPQPKKSGLLGWLGI